VTNDKTVLIWDTIKINELFSVAGQITEGGTLFFDNQWIKYREQSFLLCHSPIPISVKCNKNGWTADEQKERGSQFNTRRYFFFDLDAKNPEMEARNLRVGFVYSKFIIE
jgi:hypothetical protein